MHNFAKINKGFKQKLSLERLVYIAIIQSGATECIWELKAKIDYLVLDTKLLLINMNYVEFLFFFLEIL